MDMTQQTLISNLLNFCWILSNNINFIYCFIVTFKVLKFNLDNNCLLQQTNKQTKKKKKKDLNSENKLFKFKLYLFG